ncbi:MAG: hypothetical protein L0Y50_12960 [Beijerinckiaceae bacterium]|nr:hypothetical protein [Beijerinckiaceae bacterium]MCI0737159.1 hypothetical protein [Beijerinckiaceae bacterium]
MSRAAHDGGSGEDGFHHTHGCDDRAGAFPRIFEGIKLRQFESCDLVRASNFCQLCVRRGGTKPMGAPGLGGQLRRIDNAGVEMQPDRLGQ